MTGSQGDAAMIDPQRPLPNRRLGWLAAGVIATAMAYHLVATAAYPTFFRTPSGPLSYDWPVGWPLEFATIGVTGRIAEFRPLAAAADLFSAMALIVGTGLAASAWSGRMTLPARDRKSLVIVLVSMGCWAALLTALRVPVAVFVGWVALGIVYLAVPCTAYAVVMRARTATRFSLRTLLLMTTGIAVVLAVFAGSRSWHSRDAAKERENLAPGSAWNGTTEKAKTVKGGR